MSSKSKKKSSNKKSQIEKEISSLKEQINKTNDAAYDDVFNIRGQIGILHYELKMVHEKLQKNMIELANLKSAAKLLHSSMREDSKDENNKSRKRKIDEIMTPQKLSDLEIDFGRKEEIGELDFDLLFEDF